MKKVLMLTAVLLPALAIAQDYPGMSEADMQRMMQGMQQAGACMQDIDQASLDEFSQRAEKVESEIQALCAKGQRKAAEKKGLAFAREVNANPDIQKMRKCGEKMRGVMPEMPFMTHTQTGSPDASGRHICDE